MTEHPRTEMAAQSAIARAPAPSAPPTGERYLPVSLAGIEVNRPIPTDIWNARGALLIRKGEVLETLERQQLLSRHQLRIREADRRDWVLAGQRLHSPVTRVAPRATEEALRSVNDDWLDLHAQLSILLQQNLQVRDFLPRFQALRHKALTLMDRYPDESLFVLVQMLYDLQLGYSTSNALAAAAVCHVIGPTAGLSTEQESALFNAALTMNIGMARLQNQLALQKVGPDEHQRAAIRQHPHVGADLLVQLGVSDRLWLALVRDHHEHAQGGGYPTGRPVNHTAQQLLQLADRFVARISPRKSRRGQSVRAAARSQFLEMQSQSNPLGQLLVKQLGMYLPGSYVRLQSNEIAVVTRSTPALNAPMVMAIIGKDGIPLSSPSLRDTAQPAFAIKDTVSSDEVKVRLDPSRLFGRM
jgi:HD-GYP domain-containing protein (c-di-GMP phosphodiesterase class II)